MWIEQLDWWMGYILLAFIIIEPYFATYRRYGKGFPARDYVLMFVVARIPLISWWVLYLSVRGFIDWFRDRGKR